MDVETKWRNYERQLRCLNNLEISCKIIVEEARSIELHEFSDVNQQAYGACIQGDPF